MTSAAVACALDALAGFAPLAGRGAVRPVAVRAAPRDWRARYRLSLAYAAAGDRTRARAAAREAVRLHRAR